MPHVATHTHTTDRLVPGDLGDMGVVEYTYGPSAEHLTDAQAIARYRLARRNDDALVVLEDRDCGHWSVVELRTPEEREGYLAQKLRSYVEQILSAITLK